MTTEHTPETPQHTPEPWGYDGHGINDHAGRRLAKVSIEQFYSTGRNPEFDANSERIVACVNAMQGIENPADFVRREGAATQLIAACLQMFEALASRGGWTDSWMDDVVSAAAAVRDAALKSMGEKPRTADNLSDTAEVAGELGA